MDQDTDDNVMNTSPESNRYSDCVKPSVTHRYTDDIMENPQVTNQEPDDIFICNQLQFFFQYLIKTLE